MAKKNKKLSVAEQSIRKIRTRIILTAALFLALSTVLAGFVCVENMKVVENMTFRIVNYAFVTFSYFFIAALLVTTAVHVYEKQISKIIDMDKLTSGINYEKFLREAQLVLDNRDEETTYAVFYGDIQNFKYINDTFGYDVGDALLMSISQRIREEVGKVDGLFARISADNYTAILPYKDKNDFVETIYSIIDDICWFDEIQKAHYKPEVYVGIYCTGDDPGNRSLKITEMIDRANMAQKSVKGSSEYHIAFYTEEIRERVIAEKELERHMESALANGEFKAYFQPKYQVSTGEIVGAEALVRWDSPQTGFMSPGKFIPLFEQNGFIINLDQYIFETVCKNIREWLDQGIKVVPVSVNVSRLQFYRIDFVKRYTKIKEKYGIPDGLLELEFTESIVFENLAILRKIVLDLKKSGFTCSIDDFGSGYSSLNILKNLPMDTLKLDKLFFDDSENLTRDKALISSVINMSRALDMKTVAEGIESWAQVSFLKEIGCDIIQGYVYSEPIPHARFTHLLQGNRRKEMPADFRKDRGVSVAATEDDAIMKYTTLVGMIEGMLIEVDYDTGEYDFLNVSDAQLGKGSSQKGGDFDDVLMMIVQKYVHPDDAKSVLDRCSTVAVMTMFYQKTPKISTDLRIRSRNSADYEWARLTVSRLDDDDEHKDFRALVYLETYGTSLTSYKRNEENFDAIREIMRNICSLIYEFNPDEGTFRQIVCNTDLLGDQPLSGEISWLHECYIPKVVVPEDVASVLQFASLENIKKELDEGGKRFISTKAMVNFNDKVFGCRISISKMDIKKESKDGFRYICLFNLENADQQ
ncbi:MAG: EAL domain-containing protein [Clostridia bacterium]|nr:EAL domain-containing protein [Clostridia bacterium]